MRVSHFLFCFVYARELNLESLTLQWIGECRECAMNIFNYEQNNTKIRLENFLPIFSGECSNCSIEIGEKMILEGLQSEDKARLKIIIQILIICLFFHFSGLITQFTTFIGSIVTIDNHAKKSISLKKLREYQLALPTHYIYTETESNRSTHDQTG